MTNSNNERVITQLATVCTKVDDLCEDIKEMRIGQEEIWRQFRKEQQRANDNEKRIIQMLHDAEKERNGIRNDLKGFKDECDTRFEVSERGKKTRIAILVFAATAAFNLGIDFIKKLTGIKETDCMIICGHRGREDQNAAFKAGTSKVQWPNSYHNTTPSLAVDAAPYPLRWDDLKGFEELAKVVKRKAKELKIEIEWGGDWKKFKDYPHYQLAKKK
jgi:peptidoglycan L-alanyl-D-glutamate endopeptidase CwlK